MKRKNIFFLIPYLLPVFKIFKTNGTFFLHCPRLPLGHRYKRLCLQRIFNFQKHKKNWRIFTIAPISRVAEKSEMMLSIEQMRQLMSCMPYADKIFIKK